MARRHGAHTIGINLDPPENVYFFDEFIQGKVEKFSQCSSKSGRNLDQCFCNVLRSNNHASEHLVIFISIGLLIGISGSSMVQAQSQAEEDEMIRILMLPPEAEVTGMYVDEHGRFFVNAMHPDPDNYDATIGVINGVDWNNLPDVVPELGHQVKQLMCGTESEVVTVITKFFCKQATH